MHEAVMIATPFTDLELKNSTLTTIWLFIFLHTEFNEMWQDVANRFLLFLKPCVANRLN